MYIVTHKIILGGKDNCIFFSPKPRHYEPILIALLWKLTNIFTHNKENVNIYGLSDPVVEVINLTNYLNYRIENCYFSHETPVTAFYNVSNGEQWK